MTPSISVILPTCNDDLRLEWVLEGLCRQMVGPSEVIVVNDAGQATTEELVVSFRDRLPVQYHYFGGSKRYQRSAAARNLGVRASTGSLLLFLDGDMVPDPDLVAAYLAHHVEGIAFFAFRRHYPIELVQRFPGALDYEALRHASYADPRLRHYTAWDRPEQFRHFYSCNCSVPADVFCAIGGFDERYEGWGGEDIDLGWRLMRSGVSIYPLWGIGVGTHLDHELRPRRPQVVPWQCNPAEPLCRNSGPLRRGGATVRMHV
jgi:glycosyltransferase involved in cell wall biosynthesis